MTVALVGDTDFCAQFIVSWIRQLAAPRPTAAPTQIQENSGIRSPTIGIVRKPRMPAVSNCTIVMRPRSMRFANSPIRMISPAIGSVLTSVAISPGPSRRLKASGPAISSNPTNASAAPANAIAEGLRRKTAHCANGTIGTYSAVSSADVLLSIVWSPNVCRP